jgi:hypothetical protein
MAVVEAADHDLLFTTKRTADFNFVAGPNQPIRLRRLAVYGNFSTPARRLGLGPRAKQARHVQPDVHTQGVDGAHASNSCTSREFC